MVRPGPKTTQKEVKAEIVKLLGNNPNGLSFNKIFKELRNKKALGSFSVLSKALQDLTRAHVISVEEKKAKMKIPTRLYKLTEPIMKAIIESYVDAKKKEAIPLEKIITEKSLLKHLFFTHINNLISTYRSVLDDEEPLSEDSRWKLFLSYEINYMSAFMESVAKAVSENKMLVAQATNVAAVVQQKIVKCF